MSQDEEVKGFVTVGVFGIVYPYSLGKKLAFSDSDNNCRRLSIYQRQTIDYPFQFVDAGYEASIKNMFRVVCLSDYAIISYRIDAENWQQSYTELILVLNNSPIRKVAIIVDYKSNNISKSEFERDVEKIRKQLGCDGLDFDLTFIPMSVWKYLRHDELLTFSWYEGITIRDWINNLKPKPRYEILRRNPQVSMLFIVAAQSFLVCKVMTGVFELDYDWRNISVFGRSSYKKILLDRIWISGDHFSNRKIGAGQFLCLGREDFSHSKEYIGGIFGDYFNGDLTLPLEEVRCIQVETFWIELGIENIDLWNEFIKNPTMIVRCGLKKVKCQIVDCVANTSKRVVLRLNLFDYDSVQLSKFQKRKFDSDSQSFYTRPFEREPTLGQCLVLTFRKKKLLGLGKVLKVIYFSAKSFFIDNCIPFFERTENIPYSDISIVCSE